jgi:hypothetical protein
MLMVALVGVFVAGCDVSGITRARSSARFENDLTRSVVLRLCSSDDCRDFYPPKKTLSPGERWPVAVSSIGVPNV